MARGHCTILKSLEVRVLPGVDPGAVDDLLVGEDLPETGDQVTGTEDLRDLDGELAHRSGAEDQHRLQAAVLATGRRQIIIAGLWTEMCVAFPTLSALEEGREVYVVADASPESPRRIALPGSVLSRPTGGMLGGTLRGETSDRGVHRTVMA
jgi:hypothetical protein